MIDKNSQYAVVVSSCDAYSDAWKPFFKLFFKYWSDCPFPIYLVTNTREPIKINGAYSTTHSFIS